MFKRIILGVCLMCICTTLADNTIPNKPACLSLKIKALTLSLYTHITTAKNFIWDTAKKHPFLTVGMVMFLLSKKARKVLWKLPKNIWADIQEYPLAMALLGGFLVNYIVA